VRRGEGRRGEGNKREWDGKGQRKGEWKEKDHIGTSFYPHRAMPQTNISSYT